MDAEDKSDSNARTATHFVQTLAFHKSTSSFSFSSTNYAPTRLCRLLEWLSAHGYQLDSAAPQEDRTVAISFDDGYRHTADLLHVLIRQYRVHPLVFIPTAFIGQANAWDYSHMFRRDEHFTAQEIRELHQAGVRFGTHGHTHRDLTRLPAREAERELRLSREILEGILGEPVKALSYPFGRLNDVVERSASACGYEFGYTMRFPHATDSPLGRGRIAVYGYDTLLSISHKLSVGSLHRVEQVKANITNKLSSGTTLLNKLRRRG